MRVIICEPNTPALLLDNITDLERHLVREIAAHGESAISKRDISRLLDRRIVEDDPAIEAWANDFATAHGLERDEAHEVCLFKTPEIIR